MFVEISNSDKNGIAVKIMECNLTCETSDDVKFWFRQNPKDRNIHTLQTKPAPGMEEPYLL